MVAEKEVVVDGGDIGSVAEELSIIVEVVEADTGFEVELPQAEVERGDVGRKLAIADVVCALCGGVDIEVVVAVGDGYGGIEACVSGEPGEFHTAHESMTEAESCLETDGETRVEGQFCAKLQGSHFFGIEAESSVGYGGAGDLQGGCVMFGSRREMEDARGG